MLPRAQSTTVPLACSGDVRSGEDFQDFYQASYGRTVAMVAGILGSRPEAEDVAQEAYARALARWSRVRGYDLPEAWVRKVALRIAIDHGRRLRRGLLTTARLAAARPPAGPEPGDDLRYTPLGAALLELPLRERQVVVLHYLADLSVDAISRECSMPASTVKTRLAAARRHLGQRLSRHEEAMGA